MAIGKARYSFGGDEHIYVEFSEEMSLEAFFKGMAMSQALAQKRLPGISEICPANASYQVKFDPDVIHPRKVLEILEEIEREQSSADLEIETRIIEVPVLYGDPWTTETLLRFRERHQDPNSTDLEYAARVNNFKSVDDFIAAHSESPWFVSMVGFVAGLPWLFQLVERAKQIEVPKYLRPRTDTPKLTIGHGGCFACIYSVRGAGGYQMFGVTPAPIFDPSQSLPYLKDFMCLFKPGDIVKFKPIDRATYDGHLREIEAGTFDLRMRPVSFSLSRFLADPQGYNRTLVEALHGN